MKGLEKPRASPGVGSRSGGVRKRTLRGVPRSALEVQTKGCVI